MMLQALAVSGLKYHNHVHVAAKSHNNSKPTIEFNYAESAGKGDKLIHSVAKSVSLTNDI